MASMPLAVNAEDERFTVSACSSCSRRRNSRSARRRVAVRRLTPALAAAFSTVAPQASAASNASSAFLRPR
jgi:hypothetical protein